MQNDHTIAAISTPFGIGGLGIVRISGSRALEIARVLFHPSRPDITVADIPSHTIHHGYIRDAEESVIDEVLVSFMKAPRSFTREDTVEISCHGGVVVLKRILSEAVRAGARIAEPGEFTKRAFLNGRLDLIQAEAVIDVIRARTDAALDIAETQLQGRLSQEIERLRNKILDIAALIEAHIDFPDEDIEAYVPESLRQTSLDIVQALSTLIQTAESGRIITDGIRVAIVGRPNVGKSTLFNRLVMHDKAIVTSIPGTTRDTIDDTVVIQGIPVTFCDTAGIRNSSKVIEREGIKKSKKAIEDADIILFVLDNSRPISSYDVSMMRATDYGKRILAINKTDVPSRINAARLRELRGTSPLFRISALRGDGIGELTEGIYQFCCNAKSVLHRNEGVLVSNMRHVDKLSTSLSAMKRVSQGLSEERAPELIAIDLRHALGGLGEMLGLTSTEDLLDSIFSRFCIGK